MSYQVLARKWRPRNFSTLVGQEHVVRALTHALAEQRLHHAYLFTGTRGVGKTTIARILAKSLNCETGISPTPCGSCSTCQEIDAGRFVDLLEVDAATNTRVDEMRQLLENAVYAPTRGRFKVYVIDEVHMLSNSAFNAMLKTLEEPPEHVKFILATTDPQKIPVTVLSRCLQFNLKQMPPTAITGHLGHILQAEAIPFELPALALVARAASGSMRDALSLLDQAIAHGAGRVEEAQVRNMLGTVDRHYLFTVLESLVAADAAALMQVAADLAIRSLSFSDALQQLAVLLTRLQAAQFVPKSVDDEDPERERLLQLAKDLSPEFVQLAYQVATVGRAEMSSAPDEYAGFIMTLLRMHAFRPSTVAEALGVAPPRRSPGFPDAERALETRSVAKGVADAKAPPVSPSVANPDPVAADWSRIVGELPLSGLVRELAQNCELRLLDDTVCQLRLAPALGHLQMKPAPERLQQALNEYFGRSVQLRIELAQVETDTPAAASGRQRQAQMSQAEAAIEQDAFVRDVVENLSGSVIESSIKPIA